MGDTLCEVRRRPSTEGGWPYCVGALRRCRPRAIGVRRYTQAGGGREPCHTGEPRRAPCSPAVAVLPFKNMSGDAGQDFFSDGITEDVITALGRFSDLLVVAKSADFQLRGRNLAPAEVGRQLNPRYLLDGSFRRARDRTRVGAELIAAP